MSRSLSPTEKDIARSAPLLNAKLVEFSVLLNMPDGEAYWSIKHDGQESLSPEAAIAKHRGMKLVYGAARGHSIPWADTTEEDWLFVGGPDTHEDTIELTRIADDIAAWLGYKDRFAYAEACEQAPSEVAQLLKETP